MTACYKAHHCAWLVTGNQYGISLRYSTWGRDGEAIRNQSTGKEDRKRWRRD